MTITLERIGKNIKAERVRKGMSQDDLAAEVGISKAALSTYERAAVEIPLTKAVAISDVLDVSLEAIVGR